MNAYVTALPKAELHVHLLGAASRTTVAALAARHPGRGVPSDPAALARYYEFAGFDHFAEVYTAVNRLVTTPQDVVTLVDGLAADLSAGNVRYAEVTVTPLSHLKAGIGERELAEALDTGRQAARGHGVDIAWIFDISGDDGPAAGEATVRWILRHGPPDTVALGLGGPEHGVPRRLFQPHFATARAAGLRSVPHAGETTGPAEVWSALTDLRADRIGHGIGAATSPALLDRLAGDGVALEVCPTSNLRTGVVPTLSAHPLPLLVAAGVPVALGSDDPGMFGTTLVQEYLICQQEFALDPAELARAAVRAAFCPPATRRRLLVQIDAVARAFKPDAHPPTAPR
ncbi:adenosine deaminase [Lentzea sp. BCCO 10_0856]|uniref:Adenosine deaminase n=1 Tax=Lentzea miocenica TaxID=3095431 RepID=A0ABU4T7L2_9PSEU|nr:adenosine deaminase [Lentzea sp. BCCO 10_0856]MDX8034154.1 adenosine deaminase [Lentzea sp. BCCO 10_0856]